MSRTTVSIMKIIKQLERISGLDGIVADILESEERHITQLVNMIIKQYPEVSIFNNYRICSAKDEQAEELKQQLEAEKNKHIKIQYKCHEYTISEFCNRMDKLERLMKLVAEELTPDICDYCVNDGSKRCVEESTEEGCGNMACQFAYWRHYDEVKELLDDDEK